MSVEGNDGRNPLENNLHAVQTKINGNCEECFLNGTVCCNKMRCSYISDDSLNTFYWQSNRPVANISMLPELVKWFNNTSATTVMSLSVNMMQKAFVGKKRGI